MIVRYVGAMFCISCPRCDTLNEFYDSDHLDTIHYNCEQCGLLLPHGPFVHAVIESDIEKVSVGAYQYNGVATACFNGTQATASHWFTALMKAIHLHLKGESNG
jgi:hypothetical protein